MAASKHVARRPVLMAACGPTPSADGCFVGAELPQLDGQEAGHGGGYAWNSVGQVYQITRV